MRDYAAGQKSSINKHEQSIHLKTKNDQNNLCGFVSSQKS